MNKITNLEKNSKPRVIKEKMYTFVDPQVRGRIEALAEQTDRSPSAMIRVLVMKGLEQVGEV